MQCVSFSDSIDGVNKDRAVEKSLKSLDEEIEKWKAENGVTGPVTVTAEKPQPHPFWRSSVPSYALLPPDVVSDYAYTICWTGVVSPVVCTSGARVCGNATPRGANSPQSFSREQISYCCVDERGSSEMTKKSDKESFDPAAFLATTKPGRSILECAKGDVIFSQGDPADAVFYIQKGSLKTVMTSDEGKVFAMWP
jgi:hypothetical protein